MRCLLALAVMTGCLAGPTPYDIVVDWQTAGASDPAVTVDVSYDGTSGKTHGYTGTMRVSGETSGPTVQVCVEAQELRTVYSENNISCPGECQSQEWFALTVPQCKDVPVDATHVMFDLALR